MEYLLFSETFIIVIAIIFGILQIILFFKIWGLCNDVAKLADKFVPGISEVPELEEDAEQEIEDVKYKYMKW